MYSLTLVSYLDEEKLDECLDYDPNKKTVSNSMAVSSVEADTTPAVNDTDDFTRVDGNDA